MNLEGPLRFTLGEFDTALEVYVRGEHFPRLRISPSGDYLTGNGEEEPAQQTTKGRSAKATPTGSVTPEAIADETIRARHIAKGSLTEDHFSPDLSLPLSVLDRNPVLRSEHEGTQSLDTTYDSATRLAFTPEERGHLSRIEPGATRNATDAELRDRSTHTGEISARNVRGLKDGAFSDTTDNPTLNADNALPQAGAVRKYVQAQIAGVDTSIPKGSITREHFAPAAVDGNALAPGILRNEHFADDAEIAMSRLVVDPLARGNHRGTQPASSVTGLGPLATIPVDALRVLAADWPVIAALLKAAE